jgi:carbon-monoxide dehydrogenase medium subunit
MHALQAEQYLIGKYPSEEIIKEAAALAQAEAKPRDSLLRCSKMYRESLVNVLVENTLMDALKIAERQG